MESVSTVLQQEKEIRRCGQKQELWPFIEHFQLTLMQVFLELVGISRASRPHGDMSVLPLIAFREEKCKRRFVLSGWNQLCVFGSEWKRVKSKLTAHGIQLPISLMEDSKCSAFTTIIPANLENTANTGYLSVLFGILCSKNNTGGKVNQAPNNPFSICPSGSLLAHFIFVVV